jgi:hypothetical protein
VALNDSKNRLLAFVIAGIIFLAFWLFRPQVADDSGKDRAAQEFASETTPSTEEVRDPFRAGVMSASGKERPDGEAPDSFDEGLKRAPEPAERHSIAGLVADRDTLEPIGGASLKFSLMAPGGFSAQAVSGREGRFQLELPAGGRYELNAEADGYWNARRTFAFLEEENSVRLEMVPFLQLTGRVVDSRDVGVAGASVTVGQNYSGAIGRVTPVNTTSEEDGHFSIDGIPGKGSYLLSASHPRHPFTKMELDMPVSDPIVVRLGEAIDEDELVTVSGQVLERTSRRPIPGARVGLSSVDDMLFFSPAFLARGVADSDGRFRLPPARAGKSMVMASADDFISTAENSVNLELKEGEEASVTLLLQKPASVSGRVIGPHGESVARARVALSPEDGAPGFGAFSDFEGRFVFERATPGLNRLEVHRSGYRSHESEIALPNEEKLIIELEEQGVVLEGAARFVDGGSPERFRLELLDPKTGRLRSRTEVRVTGASGTFQRTGVTPGSYIVRITLLDGLEVEAPLSLERSRSILFLIELEPPRLQTLDFHGG